MCQLNDVIIQYIHNNVNLFVLMITTKIDIVIIIAMHVHVYTKIKIYCFFFSYRENKSKFLENVVFFFKTTCFKLSVINEQKLNLHFFNNVYI